jgi:ATP-dependent helicase YprA (DUF1998 family)
MSSERTISETITEIRESLREYIEAAYHIGDERLVEQRHQLLNEEGVLFRAPYIESTQRYTTSRKYEELDISESAKSLFHVLAHPREGESALLFDPPYTHQATALEATTRDGLSLVITTGTGSGKTESFLLPILAKLSHEASSNTDSFSTSALRALILYPMNALVNDQLGRLRLLLGDPRVTSQFIAWGGRPARFARYTSRTLYPGVRSAKKDALRLKSIETFYLALLAEAADTDSPRYNQATALVANLRARGKWPSKHDLSSWFGKHGSRWKNQRGEFIRAVLQHEDAELLTRHEVLQNPPDVLITNYSMLEYMLMRPLERPIFDATRQWLIDNPSERLMLVIDEAHLYRGAAGAEVGLLLRRLRARLSISSDRLQVICTSASFNDPDYAREFAAQLSGKLSSDFITVAGDLAFRPMADVGSIADADALAEINLDRFYDAESNQQKLEAIQSFLTYRNADSSARYIGLALLDALRDFSPLGLLVNETMLEAVPLHELGPRIFPSVDFKLAEEAVTALIALGSSAKNAEGEPGLLPCRIHAFFRGLPGLWACLDSGCLGSEAFAGSPVGTLYSQPRTNCRYCEARVFELFTCRTCGTAYARAYTDNVLEPSFLWHEPGNEFLSASGHVPELFPIDLLLEEPTRAVQPAMLDLVTGRLDTIVAGTRTRQVFLRLNRGPENGGEVDDEAGESESAGEFKPCGVCGSIAGYGRSSVQDHQTKGDEPFRALVSKQISVQPPSAQPYTDFAPLRGRKVLAFSDSRQTAARLAPNLQTYSMQDALRPVILRGWHELSAVDGFSQSLNLENLYLAALVGAHSLSVRLRPKLRGTESLHVMGQVNDALDRGALTSPGGPFELLNLGGSPPPQSLLQGIVLTLSDRYYGLQSLALASIRERPSLEPRIIELPEIPTVASSDEEKLALARLWISQWTNSTAGIYFRDMNASWDQTNRRVRAHSGKFAGMAGRFPNKETKRIFEKDWTPALLQLLCEFVTQGKFKMLAGSLALDVSGGWAYCQTCRTTQRPFPGSNLCVNCDRNTVNQIDPDTDQVFIARKGYYRSSAVRALSDPPELPMVIIAAEHTAQLNTAQSDEVFSKAEEHELLFQDVDLGITDALEQPRAAIDVLSCTTTMEVGIDIGTLSGVALRNMPPSRASYQQRSGRAGRRGNAVATVVAFGSADSHDEHYFSEPDAMIRGRVDDPVLTLDNSEIARRHVTAYLFQQYLASRLPNIDPEEQPQLFEVLGSVDGFVDPSSVLNRMDFEVWLRENEIPLLADINDWLPRELSPEEKRAVTLNLVDSTLVTIDQALGEAVAEEELANQDDDGDAIVVDFQPEQDDEQANPHRVREKLLDRLLYKGVLPRYAFPTDVVSFYVFDKDRSTRFRPEYYYAPSQGLPVALTQYAPGKEIWIDGKLWRSGALFSPMPNDRFEAWQLRRLYFECSVCQYAATRQFSEAERGETIDCPACGSESTFGSAKNWLRPPGFAHPQNVEEGTSLDDQPLRSYATRAKLVASGPADADSWQRVTSRVRQYYERKQLLVTNTGPRQEGYTYCTRCGLIEPTSIPSSTVAGSHPKPYPDERDPICTGSAATRSLVLGTDFISDVLLISLRVDSPLILRPGSLATQIALRTISEALTVAATSRLEIESGELQAEFRPALSPSGHEGLEAEIYIYDTLAGGAGFARRVGEFGRSIFEGAIEILESCPADCDNSCYRCLRSFKNRFEHSMLDRHLAASLLRYVVHDEPPIMSKTRIESAVNRLYEDLSRQGRPDLELSRNGQVNVPGIGNIEAPILATSRGREYIIGVHGPLTPDHSFDELLQNAKEFGSSIPVVLVDEILISRNLPHASQQVIAIVQ